jgi:two-component sensor histidine kinase
MYRVHSMAIVHEKLYQSADLARVDFADYAQSLLGYLWRAQGSAASAIQLDLDLKPVFLSVNAAVPCGLILNELFSNALKHAFSGRDSGKVIVSLCEDSQGMVRLGVHDDGIGLPPQMNWEQSRSLGLRIVRTLVRQLHANAEVNNVQGTHFTIFFERRS